MKNKLTILTLALALVACGNQEQAKENPAPESKQEATTNETTKQEANENQKVVYTSFYPIYNLTKQIAGDKFEVKNFSNLKTESHGWEPSAKDIADLADASLIFINGAGMEEWEESVGSTLDTEIVNTSKDVELLESDHDHGHDHEHEEEMHDHEHADEDHGHEHADEDHDHEHADEDHGHEHADEDHDHEHSDEEHDHDHEHNHGPNDPHTWLSPANAKIQAKAIADKLAEIDPENKDYFMANCEKISTELDDLMAEYSKKFEEVPMKNFVVTHKAFSYLAHDFGLNQIALSSLMSTGESGAKDLKETIDKAKELGITTIFYEKGGSDKEAKTIADEIGAKTETLNNMEFATDEQLEKETTYQEIMRGNLESLYQSMNN